MPLNDSSTLRRKRASERVPVEVPLAAGVAPTFKPPPPAPDAPKNKGGRPKKKKASNFKSTSDREIVIAQPEPASANFSTPSASRVAAASRVVTNSGPQRRMTTRSASQNARPVRERRAPINYEAKPHTPTRPPPTFPWPQKEKVLIARNDVLTVRAKHWEKEAQRSQALFQKSLLLQHELPVDRTLLHAVAPPNLPATYTTDELRGVVKTFLNTNPHHELSNIIRSLRLDDTSVRKDIKKDKENVSTAVKILLDYHLKAYSDCERGDILAELIFNRSFISCHAANNVAIKISWSVTLTIFSAIALLRSIDSSAGALNDQAIQQYAEIEDKSIHSYAGRGEGLLHKRWKICHARSIANKFAKHLLDIKHNPDSAYGDYVGMDVERGFRLSVEALGLKQKAIDSGVEVAVTGDGAAITTSTKTAGQCCVGLKFIDVDTKDPETGEYCFHSTEMNEDGTETHVYCNVQSTGTCMPVGICLQRETKELIRDGFSDLFQWCKNAEAHGIPQEGDEPAFAKIKLTGCGDMAFNQKLTATGGACKVMKHFCLYCEVHGDDNMWLRSHGSNRCSICIKNASFSCPHRAVNSFDDVVAKGHKLLNLLLDDKRRLAGGDNNLTLLDILPEGEVECFSGYDEEGSVIYEHVKLRDTLSPTGEMQRPVFDYSRHLKHTEEDAQIIKSSKMVFDPLAVGKDGDPTNIEYRIKNDGDMDDNAFRGNVFRELRLRKYEAAFITSLSLESQVQLVRDCLELRQQIQCYRDAIKIFEVASKDRILDPGQVVPCVLHSNMRTTEKVLQSLLLIGLSLNQHRRKAFIREVEVVVNRDVMGRTTMHLDDKGGWHVPMSEDGKQLSDVNLSNPQSREFISSFESVVEVCAATHPDPSVKDDWLDIVRRFRTVTGLLDSKKQFSFADVCLFQKEVDELCDVYFRQTGLHGMTNYWHLLYAGHFSYFLMKYGNLYRYSQQGWENINSIMKRSFHCNTQKGGGNRGSSKIAPVFYRLARGMLWRFGYLDGLFEEIGYEDKMEINYGKVKRMPKMHNVAVGSIEKYAYTLLKCFTPNELDSITEEVDAELEAVTGVMDDILTADA